MIAMAVSCSPELLIADEPTTALDVTVQAQILRLLLRLRQELGMALMLITHDFGVVAGMVDRARDARGSRIVEAGPVGADLPRAGARLHPRVAGGRAAAASGTIMTTARRCCRCATCRCCSRRAAARGPVLVAASRSTSPPADAGPGRRIRLRQDQHRARVLSCRQRGGGSVQLLLGHELTTVPAGELRALRRHMEVRAAEPLFQNCIRA